MHDLKMLPKARKGDRELLQRAASKYQKPKKMKRKKRKGRLKDLFEDAFDLIEDIFD